MRCSRFHAALVLAGLVLVSFGVCLTADFVWDDRPLIVDSPLVKNPGLIVDILTSSFWETGDRHDRFRSFFRPLVSLTYLVDHTLWGLRPFGYHLTNLVLHFICCWLIFYIIREEGLPDLAALGGAGLFAAHPVHVESVAWIAGRTDVVCAALVLGSWLAYVRGSGSSRRRGLRVSAWILFLLALFAKEMAATLPILVFLHGWLTHEGSGGRLGPAVRRCAPYFVVLAVYFLVRSQVLGGTASLYTLDPISWLATALFVVARYVTLLILPVGLDAHYPYSPIDSSGEPLVLVSALILAMVAFAGIYMARWSRHALFWLIWIFVGLLPVLLFGRFGDVLMADRFLYIPSIGLALLAARGFAWLTAEGRLADRKRLVAVLALCGLAALGLASGNRSRVWQNDHALFSDMLRTSPGSALVRANLGMAVYHRGEFSEAAEHFRQAIELESGYSLAHNNLAAALEQLGRPGEALEHYEKALEIAPRQLEARINAGHLMVRLGRVEQGLGVLREAVRKHPHSARARYHLADILYRLDERDAAAGHLVVARRVDRSFPPAHYLLGKIRLEQGRHAEAVEAMQRFLDLEPGSAVHVEAARQMIDEARSAAEPAARSALR